MSWLFFAVATLYIVFGLPLWAGKVPPNRLYGFRTPRTLADERAWYPVNRVAGRDLVGAGVVGAAGAALLGGGLAFLVLMAATAASVVHSFYYAATYVSELDASGPRLDLKNDLASRLRAQSARSQRTDRKQKS